MSPFWSSSSLPDFFFTCRWIPFQVAGLLHEWQISHQTPRCVYHDGLIAESFHCLRSLSVSCFHVILGSPGSHFPSTCMSQAFLTAPLERSMCPYQQSLLSFRMRSRSSMPSCASSSLDLVVTISCSLTLQICLIIALSFCYRCRRFGFVNGLASLCSAHKSCTRSHVS